MTGLRKHRPLLVVAPLGLLLLALAGFTALGRDDGVQLQVFGDAPAFALTDQLERPVTSDELRGKVVVANFVYTSCRDVCPLLSVQMQQLQERLRQDALLGGRVQLLSFTVDPARDTPAVLHVYAERHQADRDAWRFLTGPEHELVPLIVQGFRLGVDILPPPVTDQTEAHAGDEPHASYDVMHSGRFVLIDRQGRIRAYYDGREDDIDRIARDVRRLLHR